MKLEAIVTVPPHAPFVKDVARHPLVSGLRLNTVMPIKGTHAETLGRLRDYAGEKPVWVDLKSRQLRVKDFGVPPFTQITLTHNISVKTPVAAYFSDGEERATVLEVDGNRLIMQEGPRRVVGPGESINILHSSLKIEGFLTDTDLKYIDASREVGNEHYMLSFVEGKEDVDGLLAYHPGATVAAKIESMKGLRYALHDWDNEAILMGARGDLFVEVPKPHYITRAMSSLVARDTNAIAASRILPSLAYRSEPTCAEISDVDNLVRMGYKTLMLGDEICQEREPVMKALNVLYEMAVQYS